MSGGSGPRNRRVRPSQESTLLDLSAVASVPAFGSGGGWWGGGAAQTPTLPPSHSSSSLDQPLPTLVQEMPCRERTAEFATAAKSIQMRVAGSSAPPPRKTVVAEALQFNQMARRVGRDLSETCAKLEKLALLNKRSGVFNDRGNEMEELTAAVKADLAALNRQIGTLQEFVVSRRLGEGANSSARSHSGQHSRSVVVGLQSKLATVSQDFKSVLEARTETLKAAKTRREKFSGPAGAVPAGLPVSVSSGRLGSVLMGAESEGNGSANGAVSLDMGDAHLSNLTQSQLQLVDNNYVESRANAMEDIQSSIVELGSIFRQLATLVQEQGETVQRIDSHVDHTALNIEAAHGELLRYFQNISRNRWLFIKVFGVLIVFFIIFVVFLT